jgi:hypothetical protein
MLTPECFAGVLIVARERCVQVLMKNASLGEALSRDVEQELFGVSNSK